MIDRPTARRAAAPARPPERAAGNPSSPFLWCLAAVPAIAPFALAFAGARLAGALVLAAGTLLLWWAIATARDSRTASLAPWRRHGLLTATICVVLAWLAVQSLALVPAEWRHPLWREAAAALGRPLDGAISLDPAASGDVLARWAAYAGLFWLVMQCAVDRTRALGLLLAIAAAGAAAAALWLAVRAAGFALPPQAEGLALHLGLCLTIALALLALDDEGPPAMLLRNPAIRMRPVLLAGQAALIGTALAVERPGLALACLALGLSVIAAAATSSRGARPRVTACFILAVAGAAAVVSLFAGGIWAEDGAGPARWAMNGLALRAAADAPLLGHGAGTFPSLVALYRDAGAPWPLPEAATAGGILAFAAEAGAAAALAMLAVAAWLTAACARVLARGAGGEAAFAALALAALTCAGLDAALGIAAGMPGIEAVLVVIVAVGYARARPAQDQRSER